MATWTPRPGFDPMRINWGGPDEPRTEHCSYCGDALDEERGLILWNSEGWCAEFCDHCMATWFGFETFDEVEPQPEPEVTRKRK
jgi:hypothetical protein